MSGRKHPRWRATRLLLLVAVPVAGTLLAALLLPWLLGPGLAVRANADLLAPLPVELGDTPTGNTAVLAADGSLITYFYRNNRTPVPADAIAEVMEQALVDIEDSRFYEHRGVDVEGTARALMRNLVAGAVLEGGSTITQQLVKQTRLQAATTPEERLAATEESVGRKLVEARLALTLEKQHSKEEILTRYLNIVYFGRGAYGVQAAAQRYFGVDAAALTLPQAAMLAGLVQTPANDDPLTNPEGARERRDQVLRRMHELGHVTDLQLAEIVGRPVEVAPTEPPLNGCVDARVGAFFCDYLQRYLIGTLGLTQEQLVTGGLTIRTTLRPDLQLAGDQAVLAHLPLGDPLAGMFTAVEPGTGRVLAMSVNRRFGYDAADPAQESVNLNLVASQGAGSTYKVFVAAAALARGFPPWHTITTSDPYVSRVYKNGQAPYVVQNVGNYPSTLTMTEALIRSSNTYFVALEDQLGSVEGPVRTAQQMGLFSLDPVADQVVAENRGSFTLGAEATSPLALATAYSTLAASGTRCDPTPVTEILDSAGAPLTRPDGTPLPLGSSCTPGAVPPEVATTLNQILIGDTALPIGTGTRAAIPGHQIAGKTGTSQDRFSVAFVGYTPQYAASVMVLNPKINQDLGGYGGRLAAPIWRAAMLPILSAQEAVPFPPPGMPLDPPAPPPGRAPDRNQDQGRDRDRDQDRDQPQDQTQDQPQDQTQDQTQDRDRDRNRDQGRNRNRDRDREAPPAAQELPAPDQQPVDEPPPLAGAPVGPESTPELPEAGTG
jgi:membrane peptidoglycan carboxypeptidase